MDLGGLKLKFKELFCDRATYLPKPREIMIVNSECLFFLKTCETNSLDSLITDPPAGISFMNKEWDKPTNFIKDMTEIYKECLRVLKPGAYGLVWAIPRTSHWTATALEQAGFEIRDVITHIFGSGFPKSLNVSKAIDKHLGVEGEISGKNPAYRERQLEHDAQWPTPMRPEFERASGSEEAKQWEGWGSVLKPASEHWVLVRKPLGEATIAKNVLKYGTGALNIDESRITHTGSEDLTLKKIRTKIGYGNGQGKVDENHIQLYNDNGRFPTNLIVDESAVQELDEQSGNRPGFSGGGRDDNKKTGNETISNYNRGSSKHFIRSDSGGASRFFYVAKASKKDRGEANIHPTVKATKLMEYLIRLITPPKGIVLDPFMGSGSTGVAAKRLGFGFIGIEKDADYFEIAKRRIGEI